MTTPLAERRTRAASFTAHLRFSASTTRWSDSQPASFPSRGVCLPMPRLRRSEHRSQGGRTLYAEATAVIGRAGDGRTLYFKNDQTFAAYARGSSR